MERLSLGPAASTSTLVQGPPARTPPVAIQQTGSGNPATVLTPPEGVKRRVASGDGGYVVMSPGVLAAPLTSR